jgi:hypothetical protein
MSDSPQESQKRHLSKIRPHGLDRRVMLSIGNIPDGEEAFVKASIAALAVIRPALDGAFPVT